jgi:hypothetical protein
MKGRKTSHVLYLLCLDVLFFLLFGESGENVFKVEKRKNFTIMQSCLFFFLRKKRSLFYPEVEEKEQNRQRFEVFIYLYTGKKQQVSTMRTS